MAKSTKKEPGQSANSADSSRETPRQILDRVERESESIGTSGLARTANKTARDMSRGRDDEDDAIEIWGKRIGRSLGAVVVVYLIYHLVTTYMLSN